MALRPKGNPLPIDENVNLPKAVRDAAKAADAHYTAPQDPASAPEDTIVITNPPPEPPQDNPPQDPPQPAPVTPQGNPPPNDPEELWEHRYNSEKGRHDITKRQLADLSTHVQGLQNLVEDLQAQLATRQTPAPLTPAQMELLTPEQRADYGDEMLDVVGKRAREVLTPEMAEMKAQLESLQRAVQGTAQQVARTDREKMHDELERAIPDWKVVNKDDKFKSWLALPDAFSGVIRHKLLTQAYENNQTSRVLAFFKGFLSEEAALDPQSPGNVSGPAPTHDPKPSLEQFAAPGRARTPASGSPAPVEKPIITTSQITAFYAAVRKGQYAGREEEQKSLETEIFAAQREGRVRTG